MTSYPPDAAQNPQIRVGCKLTYHFPQPTPLILLLNVHYSRASDVVRPDVLVTRPALPQRAYRDSFGNWCLRLVSPAGRLQFSTDALVNDSGTPDPVHLSAQQHSVDSLPEETLPFLLGSRYCETDRLSEIAWKLFGSAPLGWPRVQAICDYVNARIHFGYEFARPTKTAWDVFTEQQGVCRDYAHLAIAFCRCLNIPARYCSGYLTDMGLPPPYAPMDFAGWFEAYLGGAWHVFDPRNNVPRIGRILVARGRDAADVAIATTFGPNTLESFTVWAYEIDATNAPQWGVLPSA